MRIVYMGTPEFAVKPLESILNAGHEVAACFTQPDKPKGRSKRPVPPPVKVRAEELNIPVFQPVKLKEQENTDIIRDIAPDMIVVAAYGQILPESILNIPEYGCINIHASLLPKYRGAAPIEWAIINGEKETGVTTMYMAKGLDTGDMIEKTEVPINADDTGITLHEKLSIAGADLIISTIEKIADNNISRIPQQDELSSYAPMLCKEMGRIDFCKNAAELERLVRGLLPWPCAYTAIGGKNVKIYEAEVVITEGTDYEELKPGSIFGITKKSFNIACGQNALRIKKLQPEGKKVMECAAYMAGNRLTEGSQAGIMQ